MIYGSTPNQTRTNQMAPDDLDDEADDVLYATDPEPAGTETTVGDDTPSYQQREWLWRHYHVYERSQPEMAELADVSSPTISEWMDRHNIPTRQHAKAQSLAKGGDKRLWDEAWLRREYVDRERSIGDIADDLGHSTSAVLSALRRAGIETRDLGTALEIRHADDDGSAPWRDPEWLFAAYVRQGLSSHEIAEICDVDHSTILNWLDRHGIPRRSNRVAQLERFKAEKATEDDRALISSEGIDASWTDIQDRQHDRYLPYRDPNWLRTQLEKGHGYETIAELCDVECTGTTVRAWAIRFELDDRESASPDEGDSDQIERLQRRADTPEYGPNEIKRVRDEAGLTQSELAERLGTAKSTVEFWEMGCHTPSARYRLQIREIEKQARTDGD